MNDNSNIIQAMFDDMSLRFSTSHDVQCFNGNLRVATMCSGTESPLLALDMLSKALSKNHDVKLNVQHVFSCEIEPFKQAYIERNFAPALLFRDIRELGDDTATTAYGAVVKVPGDVDVLVAGTSCVDYSALNLHRKELEANGESGQTFRGMLAWVDKHSPPVVILENVCQAPWDKMQKMFEARGYVCSRARVDAKKYYLPQTRMRVYMVAIKGSGNNAGSKWNSCMKSLEAPLNTNLEEFLLHPDDCRVDELKGRCLKRPRVTLDWGRCHSRHVKCRTDERLGDDTPYSRWTLGCALPDYAWGDWAKFQTDRKLDLMDIHYLRAAKKSVDATSKSLIWNLQQNVDRSSNTGGQRQLYGVAPCWTPSMIGFSTIRGGLVMGLEGLSLQGIPVNSISLTKETEVQLSDLAGNAMSTTVVGAALLSALWVNKTCHGAPLCQTARRGLPQIITDGSHLRAVDMTSRQQRTPGEMIRLARLTHRTCACEGRDERCEHLLRCSSCGHTACSSCGVNPKHDYRAIEHHESKDVRAFRTGIVKCVPMKLELANRVFVFQNVIRGRFWRAVYASDDSGWALELAFDEDTAATWRIFQGGKCLARATVADDSSSFVEPTTWSMARSTLAEIQVVGKGHLVDSWHARIGLKNNKSGNSRWSRYEIVGPECVAGTYDWLPECGGAHMSLHKQRGKDLFFFMDPTSCGSISSDKFVFSGSHHRLAPNESRDTVARLKSHFVESDQRQSTLQITVNDFTDTKTMRIKPKECIRALFVSLDIQSISHASVSCAQSAALIKIVVPLSAAEKVKWMTKDEEINNLKTLSWINTVTLPKTYSEFTALTLTSASCASCAPRNPEMILTRKSGQAHFQVAEDPEQCKNFELKMKQRPSVFIAKWTCSETHDLGTLTIGVNPHSLAHRAIAAQEGSLRQNSFVPFAPAVVEWRLVSTTDESAASAFVEFTLLSNKDDVPSDQPSKWNSLLPLRPEQLRSLAWMKRQELDGASYEETEVSECTSTFLPVRMEARATRRRCIRGGVVADQVGFGKTAVTVALIASSRKRQPDQPETIATKATLVLVPSQLMKQWPDEINRFCPGLRTIVVRTINDLKKLSVKDIQSADIVLVAITVLRSSIYFDRLADIAGTATLPQDSDRLFARQYEQCVGRLSERVKNMKNGDFSMAAETVMRTAVQSERLKGAKLTKATLLAGGEHLYNNSEAAPKESKTYSTFTSLRDIHGPPLEMFNWKRLVVDEFTYLQAVDRTVVLSVVAHSKWCLSGTPPLGVFGDIKTAASLIGVNLGRDESPSHCRKEMTQVDFFNSYSQMRASATWKTHRRLLAQQFLDVFARQNVAEIGEIELQDEIHKIAFSQEERAVYVELKNYLRITDVKNRKTPLQSHNEALLRVCSLFDNDAGNKSSARGAQLQQIQQNVVDQLKTARNLVVAVEKACGGWPDKFDNFFRDWCRQTLKKGTGDPEVDVWITGFLTNDSNISGGFQGLPSVGATLLLDEMEAEVLQYGGVWKNKALLQFEDGEQRELDLKITPWELVVRGKFDEKTQTTNKVIEVREHVHKARKMLKDMIAKQRSLRFFDHLVGEETNPTLAGCGHSNTAANLEKCAVKGRCSVKGCDSVARHDDIVSGDFVRETNKKATPPHGSKIAYMLNLVKRLSVDDKIIMFCQFVELADQIESYFNHNNVRTLQLSGNVHKQTRTLELFQKDPSPRVLVMMARAESAAGANLACANHVFFAHPLTATTEQERRATETQAVGRVRRYGQSKKVFVWRFFIEDSIEEKLMNINPDER